MRDVRALADSNVVVLRTHGARMDGSATGLAAALARWPNVERLTADCDVRSAATISAAPLSKLKALELWVEHAAGARLEGWSTVGARGWSKAGARERWHGREHSSPQPHSSSTDSGAECVGLPRLRVLCPWHQGCARLRPAAQAVAQLLRHLRSWSSCRLHPPGRPDNLRGHRLRHLTVGQMCQAEEALNYGKQSDVRPCTVAGLCRAPIPLHQQVCSPGEPGGAPGVPQFGAP